MSGGGAVNCEIGAAECMLDPAYPGNGVVDSDAVTAVTSAVAAPGASFFTFCGVDGGSSR